MNPVRLITLAGIILVAAFARLIPHPPNVTPIMAMALLGGATIGNRTLAFLIPLAAMFISDIVLGLHGTLLFVYGAILLTVALGAWLQNHKGWLPTALTAIGAGMLFYLITNFGVWLTGTMYPKTFAGLLECYVAALPFLRNSVIGNLAYTGVLFGGFALLENTFHALKPATEPVNA